MKSILEVKLATAHVILPLTEFLKSSSLISLHQTDSHKMTIKAAVEKNTFFFVSFTTDKVENEMLIDIVKMLRSRPEKVSHGLKLFVLGISKLE